ncbi:MAG: hypothetical protein NC904_05765 [Candidatus Omnitrophica bacterium]|nr:hypothetical protein [Candidatus Omnitrophota bacterium]
MVTGIINGNSAFPRIWAGLNRTFNTIGSNTTIDRWKHQQADNLNIKEKISKLSFSVILFIDEYSSQKSSRI